MRMWGERSRVGRTAVIWVSDILGFKWKWAIWVTRSERQLSIKVRGPGRGNLHSSTAIFKIKGLSMKRKKRKVIYWQSPSLLTVFLATMWILPSITKKKKQKQLQSGLILLYNNAAFQVTGQRCYGRAQTDSSFVAGRAKPVQERVHLPNAPFPAFPATSRLTSTEQEVMKGRTAWCCEKGLLRPHGEF